MSIKATTNVDGYAVVYINIQLEESVRANPGEVNNLLNYWLLRYIIRHFADARKIKSKITRDVMVQKLAVLHPSVCK